LSASNTNVSKLIYDYIAGWEKEIGGQTPWCRPAHCPSSATTTATAAGCDRPNTILVDSEQLESGRA
jgi:type III restriction enzyme